MSSSTKVISIQRGKHGLGFILSSQAPCHVSSVNQNGPADVAGLMAGDEILEVSGCDVSNCTHEQVVRLILQHTTNLVTLKVRSYEVSDESTANGSNAAEVNAAWDSNGKEGLYKPGGSNIFDSISKVVKDLKGGSMFTPSSPSPRKTSKGDLIDRKTSKTSDFVGRKTSQGNLLQDFASSSSQGLTQRGNSQKHKAPAPQNAEDGSGPRKKSAQTPGKLDSLSTRRCVVLNSETVLHGPGTSSCVIGSGSQSQGAQVLVTFDSTKVEGTTSQSTFQKGNNLAASINAATVQMKSFPATQPGQSRFCECAESGALSDLSGIPCSNLMCPRRSLTSIETGIQGERDSAFQTVVSYKSTVEMSKVQNLAAASLNAINSCVQKIQRNIRSSSSLVLMTISKFGITLTNPVGKDIVNYPLRSLAFSGTCSSDKRYFGLVTKKVLSDHSKALSSSYQKSPKLAPQSVVVCSCHVFMVDWNLFEHDAHSDTADIFNLTCQGSEKYAGCRAFPPDSTFILQELNAFYKEQVRVHSQSSPASSSSSSPVSIPKRSQSADGKVVQERRGSPAIVIGQSEQMHQGQLADSSKWSPQDPLKLMIHSSGSPVGDTDSNTDQYGMEERNVHGNVTRDGMQSKKEGKSPTTKGKWRKISEPNFRGTPNSKDRRKPPAPPPRISSIPKNMSDLAERPPPSGRTARRRRSDSALSPSDSVKERMRRNIDKQDQSILNSGDRLKVESNDPKRRSLLGSLSDVSNDSDVQVDRVEGWGRSFEKFLNDPLGLRNFQEFLKKEFSEENIQFWIACEEFKLIQDPEKMRKRAAEIFAQFLSPGAVHLVNVNQDAYERATERVQSPGLDMFTEAQTQVYQLMKLDSYMRFLKSDVYKDCLMAEEEERAIPFQDEVEDESPKDRSVWYTRKFRSSAKELQDSSRKPGLLNFLSKGKAGKTMGDTPRKERSLSADSIQDLSRSPPLHGNGLKSQPWNGSKKNKSPSTFVRVILPDGSSSMITAEAGQTIRQSLRDLCESRKLTLATFDVFVGYNKKVIDLDQEITALEENVIFLERRVLLRLDLPNGRSVGIKSSPSKLLFEVLAPILLKNGFQLDDYVFVEISDKTIVPVDTQVASMENKHLVTRPAPKRQDNENAASKSPHADSTRSSFRRMRSTSFRDEKKVSRTEESSEKDRVGGGARRPPEGAGRGEEQLTRKFSNDMRHLLMGRSRSVDDDGTQALLTVLKRSQFGRMDDQRGLIPKNVELPDFLKTSSESISASTPVPVRSSSCSSKSPLTSTKSVIGNGPSFSSPVLATHQLPLNFPESPLICDDAYANLRPAAEVLQDTSFAMDTGGRSGLFSVKSWRDVQTSDRQIVASASPAFSRDLFGEKYSLGTKLSKSDSVLTGAASKLSSSYPPNENRSHFRTDARGRSSVTEDDRVVELVNANGPSVPHKLCAWRSNEGSLESSSHGSLSSTETLNVTSHGSRPPLSPDSGFCFASSGDLAMLKSARSSSMGAGGDRAPQAQQRARPRPISQHERTAILRGLEVDDCEVIAGPGDDEIIDRTLVAPSNGDGRPSTPSGSIEGAFSAGSVVAHPVSRSHAAQAGSGGQSASGGQSVASRRPPVSLPASQQRLSAESGVSSSSASTDSSRRSAPKGNPTFAGRSFFMAADACSDNPTFV